MTGELENLRRILLEGIRLSRQSSHGKRAPAREAVTLLNEAQGGLRAFVEAHPDRPEGWDLLALAEECLLDYAAARRCLERAVSLSGNRSKKMLKRLALYRQAEGEWGRL